MDNPYIAQVERLSGQERLIQMQIWEKIEKNPPLNIKSQLVREAEAIVRAEATASLEKKQSDVVRDAESLARLKFMNSPRLEVDEEASRVLLNELMEPKSSKDLFESVLNMCDQQHIKSFSA